jgi:hypothetical protein
MHYKFNFYIIYCEKYELIINIQKLPVTISSLLHAIASISYLELQFHEEEYRSSIYINENTNIYIATD